MSLARFASCIGSLALALGWAAAGQAGTRSYSLVECGAQLAIGDGLMLPIQSVMLTASGNRTATGTHFPPLLIPLAPGPHTVVGTTSMTAQQKLMIPASVLSRPAQPASIGVFPTRTASIAYRGNPILYAVATNLKYVWPKTTVTFSTGARTGPKTFTATTPGIPGMSNHIRYSNPLPLKFGGPARFAIHAGPPGGVYPQAPVTIYKIAFPTLGKGPPPCTHTALTPVPFPGPGNPYCIAELAQALPSGTAAIGGPVSFFVSTPGGTPNALISTMSFMTPGGSTITNGPGPLPGVGIGKFATRGTVDFFTFTPNHTRRGFTNMAASYGYPFTTGMITLSAPGARGRTEFFMITGKDSRTAWGGGGIQLVSGGLSVRSTTGSNANRGWVGCHLVHKSKTPALSPRLLAAGAGLLLLAFLYAVRHRFAK